MFVGWASVDKLRRQIKLWSVRARHGAMCRPVGGSGEGWIIRWSVREVINSRPRRVRSAEGPQVGSAILSALPLWEASET